MGRKVGEGAVSLFRGELGPHRTQGGLVEAYLLTKWHLDPSSRLATTDMGRKVGGLYPLFTIQYNTKVT